MMGQRRRHGGWHRVLRVGHGLLVVGLSIGLAACSTSGVDETDRRLPRGYDPMGEAARAMQDPNRPASMRVAFAVREYTLPLDESIDEGLARTLPAPDGSGVLSDWRENGVRIVVLKQAAASEFMRALPVRLSERITRHVTMGDAVPIATTSIARPSRSRAASVKDDWDAQPLPWYGTVSREPTRSGRVDLLIRTAPGAGGSLGLEVWPQHLETSSVRPRMVSGANPSDGGRLMAPGDMRLSGEVISTLHTTTRISGDEALVVALDRPWPEIPTAPTSERVWPDALATLGVSVSSLYASVYAKCERPLFPAIRPPQLVRSCGTAWLAEPERQPRIQRLLVISRIAD